VNKLATKSIHKRKKYNKKHLANKLDGLAKKVAKRNVYVVEKTDPGYNILNYIDKSILVENVPFLNVAKSACDSFNKSEEEVKGHHMQKHVDKYFKHYMDLQFYKHTIKHSDDVVKVFTAGVRMQDSLDFIKEAKLRLLNF
jgi:hypothetical protein